MDGILSFISKYGVAGIIIAAVILAVLMFRNDLALREQKNRIKELLERQNRKYRRNRETHELEEEDDEGAAVTDDTVRKYENRFDELSSEHSIYEQLIPVFPMLGILGTVAGLMLYNNEGDTAALARAMATALDTTFWGLVAAVILKVFDAIFPSKSINDVEVMLDYFDRKLELADKYEEQKS